MEVTRITSIASKGEGLVATRNISLKDSIYTVNYPVISAISTENLSIFCYHCCAASQPNPNTFSIGQYRDVHLLKCTGCKTAHFCGKKCQTAAWRAYHKFECKKMGTLPRTLHESVRAVQRICLQRDNGLIQDEEWEKLLALISHIDDLRKVGGDRWVTLMLYAKAAHEYSGTKQTLKTALELMCILKCNGLTLQNTAGDPIGLFIDIRLVKINHSCQGNVFVHRPIYTNSTGWPQQQPGRPMVQLLPLREIREGEELLFPYDDFHDDVEVRQASLQENYFFTCACEMCILDKSRKIEMIKTNPELATSINVWQESVLDALKPIKEQDLLLDLALTPRNIARLEAIAEEARQKKLVSKSPHSYGQILHELKMLYVNQTYEYDKGLICELQEFFIIGPMICKSPLDPITVISAFYILQLLAILDETYFPNNGCAPNIMQARRNIEAKGFCRQSFTFWRLRICEYFRLALSDCSRLDMAEFFRRDLATIAISYQSDVRHLLRSESVERKSNTELEALIGPMQESWRNILKSFTSSPL